MTSDRMQARRDAFLMLTDRMTPEYLGRFLVTLDTADGLEWWTRDEGAEDAARAIARMYGAKFHDLDNQ